MHVQGGKTLSYANGSTRTHTTIHHFLSICSQRRLMKTLPLQQCAAHCGCSHAGQVSAAVGCLFSKSGTRRSGPAPRSPLEKSEHHCVWLEKSGRVDTVRTHRTVSNQAAILSFQSPRTNQWWGLGARCRHGHAIDMQDSLSHQRPSRLQDPEHGCSSERAKTDEGPR